MYDTQTVGLGTSKKMLSEEDKYVKMKYKRKAKISKQNKCVEQKMCLGKC